MPNPIIECKFQLSETKIKEICLKSKLDKPGISMGLNSFCINNDNKADVNAMCKMIVDVMHVMQSKPNQRLSISVQPDLLADVKANVEYNISRTKNAAERAELIKTCNMTEFKSTEQKIEAKSQQTLQSLNDIDIRATYKDKNGATLPLRNNAIEDMGKDRDLLMALMKDLAEKMWANNATIQSVTVPLEHQSGFKQAIKNYLQRNKEKDPDKSSKSEMKLKQLCNLIDTLPIIDSTAAKNMREAASNKPGLRM